MSTTTPKRPRAASGAAAKRRANASSTPRAKTTPQAAPEGPGVAQRVWLGLAHAVGGAVRAIGPERVAKEDRRDGFPFMLLLLAVLGAVMVWFLPGDPIARAINDYTFGGLFGRVAGVLPVVFAAFALWLFRHPSTLDDNGRIAAGLFMGLSGAATLAHVAGGGPAPTDGMPELSKAGGVFGWMFGGPLVFLTTGIGASIIAVLFMALSVFVVTKTPPNRVGDRLRDLWAWLFGLEPSDAAHARGRGGAREGDDLLAGEAASGDGAGSGDDEKLPWWRRNATGREVDPAFDSPVVDDAEARGTEDGLTALFDVDARGESDDLVAPTAGRGDRKSVV